MKTNILIFFLITLLKSQIHDWHGFQVDLSRFENKTDSSVMRMNGEVVGSWVWSIEKKGELLIVKDKSILTGKIEER
ncbi:MAG: hypothetical protein KDD94_14155, partial [Calditrichaeota bacterium]|nr:hypothetical protein [Calditrichota bacterium]